MEKQPISCIDCSSTCCGDGMQLQLTKDEAAFICDGGTKLNIILPTVDLGFTFSGSSGLIEMMPNHGLYVFKGRCGYVVEENGRSKCSIHEVENRPKACKDFPAGSMRCREIRQIRGINN